MTTPETPEQTAARIVREVYDVASQITFVERALLIREIVKAVGEALESEVTEQGKNAPQGRQWELDRLATIGDPSERYYAATLAEQR